MFKVGDRVYIPSGPERKPLRPSFYGIVIREGDEYGYLKVDWSDGQITNIASSALDYFTDTQYLEFLLCPVNVSQ